MKHGFDSTTVNGIFIRSNPNIRIFGVEYSIRRTIRLHIFVESNPCFVFRIFGHSTMMHVTLIEELVQFKNEIATYSTYTNRACIATSPSMSSSTSLATLLCHVTLPRRFATSLCHVAPMLEIPEMRSVHQTNQESEQVMQGNTSHKGVIKVVVCHAVVSDIRNK